jgi:sialate O-acetylesterase
MKAAPLFRHLVLVSFVTVTARADVTLPAIFSEHMVLLKSASTPIWGKAEPGEVVTVDFRGRAAVANAGPDGKWKVSLDLSDAKPGPFEMTVSGKNKIVIPDVVVGQPWLLIGQSNAERLLKESANAPAEIARSANPMLRQFRIEKKAADAPQDDSKGTWAVATPQTTPDFSAIGYYFAKKLQGELQQPIGIVNGSWGGTFIEAWMSEEAINQDPDLRAGEAARRELMAAARPQRAGYIKSFGEWLAANGRQDRPCPDPAAYAGEEISTTGWTPITLPGKVAGPDLPPNGAIWIRKELEVPAAVEGTVIKISLGRMTCFEDTYWNGKKIFELSYQKLPGEGYFHYFAIPQDQLHAGKAVLAIRLYAPTLPPVISAGADRFYVGPVPIGGQWLAKAEYSLPALSASELASVPKPPSQPPAMKAAGIFNGVVHPVIPYGIAGMLWYQGESNMGIAYQYRTSFPLFIRDLREKWHQPELPFYFCQLPGNFAKTTLPGESAWAEMRESQSRALSLPNTAQAVIIDLGEAEDMHPRNKADVGARLARIALKRQYGQSQLVDSGPVYDSMAMEGGKIRVRFTHTDGGLVARPLPPTYDVQTLLNRTAPLVPNIPGSELQGFAICGEDHRWVWAEAKIEGDTVLVWSEKVTAPVAVRYAWADNPTCNLYNAADLPAAPFRTDNFPTTTDTKRFGLSPEGRY